MALRFLGALRRASALALVIPVLLGSVALAQNSTVPTAPPGDNSNKAASTAFVQQAIGSGFIVAAPPLTASYLTGTWTVGLNTGAGLDVQAGNLIVKTPSVGDIGGVYSSAGVTNQWITSINTDGTVSRSQPAFSNISGNIAVSQMSGGTGATSSTFWNGAGAWAAVSFPNITGNISTSQMNGGTGATNRTFFSGAGAWTSTFGDNTGTTQINVNGANSGTGAGAQWAVLNNGAYLGGLGNYSAIFGSAPGLRSHPLQRRSSSVQHPVLLIQSLYSLGVIKLIVMAAVELVL